MHLLRLIPALIAILVASTTALLAFHWVGGFVSFSAYQSAFGNAVVEQVYLTCVERKNTSRVESTNAACVGQLVAYMFSALGSVALGGFTVGTAESGFGGVQQTNDPKGKDPPAKRDVTLDDTRLAAVNRLLQHCNNTSDHPVMATGVTDSDVHGADGIAIRFNVRSEDSTLQVHTNGTHGMAVFEPDAGLSQRDFLPTDGHCYTFQGVNGIKMEAHGINIPHSSDYMKDLNDIADRFARSDLQPKPSFQGSDAWTYQACNKQKTATFIFGKLIAELNRPGKNYESVKPPGC